LCLVGNNPYKHKTYLYWRKDILLERFLHNNKEDFIDNCLSELYNGFNAGIGTAAWVEGADLKKGGWSNAT